jgi:thiosulfate/3-mercaptopyruvate sulfurtransferase
MMLMRILVLLSMIFWLGCQQTPTKVFQSVPTQVKEGADAKTKAEIQLTEQTVLVDARPAFDFSVSHLNGSINLRPEDFTQRESPMLGYLDADTFSLARYLARKGISPETPVVVVGRGLQGNGEEGRVAWTLKYLGVKDVSFASIDYFSIPLTTAEAPPKAAVPIWKPQVDETLQTERQPFISEMMRPRIDEDSTVIIDVRSAEEYLGKVSSKTTKPPPDIGAINIPWTEFFARNGLVNETIKTKLQSQGITEARKILVIANKGIESGAVTLALRMLGYGKASNYSGGYLELTSQKILK